MITAHPGLPEFDYIQPATLEEASSFLARHAGEDVLVHHGQSLTVVPDMGGAIPKIDDAPWPAFPADMMSTAIVVATQAVGSVLIHEKMFESRLYFVDKLIGMGARIVLCDPHRCIVQGPSSLSERKLSSLFLGVLTLQVGRRPRMRIEIPAYVGLLSVCYVLSDRLLAGCTVNAWKVRISARVWPSSPPRCVRRDQA